MASDKLRTFQDANFTSEVLESDVPVLVDFWAPWCGPCRMIAPLVEKAAVEYDGRAKVGKLNVDEAKAIAQKYSIRSIPALIVFKDGKPVNQHVGTIAQSGLNQLIEKAL